METMYCVKCKKKKKVNAKKVRMKTKSGMRNTLQAKCPTCGTKMFKFVK